MWYVIKPYKTSELRAIAWNGDTRQGYLGAVIGGATALMTLEHRAASRLSASMNRQIRARGTSESV